MRRSPPCIAAIDVGTSRVACAVAQKRDGDLHFLGLGEQECRGGLRKGVVTDIDTASEAVRSAVEAAFTMAGCRMQASVVNVSGEHVRSLPSRAMVKVAGTTISPAEIRSVLEAAQAVPHPEERRMLHTLPRQYLVDGNDGVRRPQNMAAVRLDVDALIVTADNNVCRNLEQVLRAGSMQNSIKVASGVCAAAAVLDSDELQIGTAVLDIGAGTTDIAVFKDGMLQMLDVVPLGGDMVTADIVRVLRIPTDVAEDLKLRYGSVQPTQVGDSEILEIPVATSGSRTIARQNFAAIVSTRYSEILKQALGRLQAAEIESSDLGSIVLTGGGAKVEFLSSLGEEIFHSGVRLGEPRVSGNLEGLMKNPSVAALVGSMRFIAESPPPFDCCFSEGEAVPGPATAGGNWFSLIHRWLKENY